MTGKNNPTVVLHAPKDLRIEQRLVPVPKENEVLLQIESVGLCGSDVHYFCHGKNGVKVVQYPFVLGHESSGTVVNVGANVKTLKPGDRVAIEPGIPCRECKNCKRGRYNICRFIRFCSSPPIDGTLTTYFAHPADFCYKLPGHVSLEEGAILEPLSVGVHACKRANVNVESTVLILGAGPVGLLTLIVAKAMGATKTVVTDILDTRLNVAKQLGATHTLKVTSSDKEQEIVDKIIELFDGEQPNTSLDCSGADQSIRIAFLATAPGGVAVMVGVGKLDVNVPLTIAMAKEIDIRGCFRYANCYEAALGLIASGKIDVKPLITHHYDLEDSQLAFDQAVTGKDNPIKIMIHPNPNWRQSHT